MSTVTAKSINSTGKDVMLVGDRRMLWDQKSMWFEGQGWIQLYNAGAVLLQNRSNMPMTFGRTNIKEIPLQAQRPQTPPSPESLHESPGTF